MISNYLCVIIFKIPIKTKINMWAPINISENIIPSISDNLSDLKVRKCNINLEELTDKELLQLYKHITEFIKELEDMQKKESE